MSVKQNVNEIRKKTGRVIRIERIKRDLQVKELAQMSGLSADHLGKLELGKIPVRVEHLVVIAEAMKCKAADLLPQGDI